MFKNFWHAVCLSNAIKRKKAIEVTLADTRIVLFRHSNGEVSALNAVCPHRGAALKLGTVSNSCLACAYHGWQFDAKGRCTKIPANDGGKAGSQFNTVYLPCMEKYGFVFVYIGEGNPDEGFPLIDIPELNEAGKWGVIYGDTLWHTHWTRSVENLNDFSHTAIVHESFGDPANPEIPQYKVEKTDTSVAASVDFCPPMNLVQYILRNGQQSLVPTKATFYMPNITRLDVEIGKWHMIVVVFHHQVSEDKTIMHWIQLRDFFKCSLFDLDARRRITEVIDEDGPIVESQRPFHVPLELSEEKHVPSDALHIAFRQLLTQHSNLAVESVKFRTAS